MTIPDGFVPINIRTGFLASFGPLYVNREEGKLGFYVAAQHLNPFEVCHGGAIATFADMQILAARKGSGTKLGRTPTINISVDYLAPAALGAWVEADVTLVKATRTLIFTQALITANGELVARSSGIYRNFSDDLGADTTQEAGSADS